MGMIRGKRVLLVFGWKMCIGSEIYVYIISIVVILDRECDYGKEKEFSIISMVV